MTARLLATWIVLAAAPAVAADVLPLARGTYVQADTPCADPPFAAIRDYDGRGLPTPHSRDCRARILSQRGGSYRVANDCIGAGEGPAARDVERLTIRPLSRTRFAMSGITFRLCPGERLPTSLRLRARR